MTAMSERLPEPFGGVDEAVFGALPPDALGLWHIYADVMEEWRKEWGVTVGSYPSRAEVVRVLKRHTHTDPDTGITHFDYITRALQEKGMEPCDLGE